MLLAISCLGLLCFLGITPAIVVAAEPTRSSEPLVRLPVASNRPLGMGPAKFVDAVRGDDAADGSEARPWRTVTRALTGILPGETLYLRGGIYYEAVRWAASGRADAPLTIRSYPGELATIDAGFPEFFRDAEHAWELVPGTSDEYRSTRTYRNLRYVLGSFGDSLIGLNTYYHAQDLRATNEAWIQLPVTAQQLAAKQTTAKNIGLRAEVEPLYCGPGLWYDDATGRIHVRLAHTHLTNRPNYTGPNDPRRVPLIVTAAHSIPLRFDGAAHIRVQDLVVRGAGHETVLFEQCQDLKFDNVTFWCGSSGLRAYGLRQLTLSHCGVYGNVPPWTFRSDTSLRARPGSGARDITRLNTHAMLIPSAMRESDVYAYPQNDDWEIEYCTFTDGHDGIYLGGLNAKFHHNLLERVQDDGIYLSPMYPSYSAKPFEIHIYQNVFRDSLTAVAFGGPEPRTTDRIFIYRNLFQLNTRVHTGRPEVAGAAPQSIASRPMSDHGSPPWPAMWIYHNTFHMLDAGRSAEHSLTAGATPDRPKHLINNIITTGYRRAVGETVSMVALPAASNPPPPVVVPDANTGSSDGNLYWFGASPADQAEAIFGRYRTSPAFAESAKQYPGGFTSRSIAVNPQLDEHDIPLAGSPVINKGAAIPAEWPDTLRGQDRDQPDIGALPAGAKPLTVGRDAAP